jgi:capsule biosynthesis phosphatase
MWYKMIEEKNVIVLDIDGTLCELKTSSQNYLSVLPKDDIVSQVRKYKQMGFYIILFTSRSMRTFQGNIGKINANTAKQLIEWLEKFNIPYDELHFGKPWCGKNGFYVDDRAIRPSEFLTLTQEQIMELIQKEQRGSSH